MYYRRANAAIIVYDITSNKSFEEAKQWIKGKRELKGYVGVNFTIKLKTYFNLCTEPACTK